jgi:transcriptional regulator
MYLPAAFAETDTSKIHEFMDRHGFATLISQGSAGMIASHLPLLLEPEAGRNGTLFGHMARANPQWKDVRGDVLAIFAGPHAYVSPSWYEEEGTVPTWNYVAVHAYGVFRLVEDRDGLLEILRKSVRTYEGSRPEPWPFDESAKHVDTMLKAIVGFRIEIGRLEGKWKLSQNQPEARREKVIQGLGRQTDEDSRAIAALMIERARPPAGT